MTAPARLVPSWGGLTALLLGLGLAVLPARAQEPVNDLPEDIQALVDAGKAVVLPLGDALKTQDTVADKEAGEGPSDDDGAVESVADDSDVADVAEADAVLLDDQTNEGVGDDIVVEEPQVEIVEEETTEPLQPEIVPEPEAVTDAVPEEDVIDAPVEEIVASEEIETPEPVSLIEDEVDEHEAGQAEVSVDLESEIETVQIEDETFGEGSADVVDVEDPVTETIVVEETVVDEVIVDPQTDEPAAEAIIVEETVIEDVATAEPAIEQTPEEQAVAEDIPLDVAATEGPEPETVEVVADEPAPEETVAEPVEAEPEPEEIVLAETVVEAPTVEESADDQSDTLVGAMVPLRTAELGNAESIGPYRLWLASYKTVRQAKEGWQQIALANQDLLADLTPIIVLKDLGQDEGTFFRLQAGPLQSQGSASARCTALVDRNVYCSVLGP